MKEIIDNIIITEGGYVDLPEDRGGATKYGITIGTLQKYRGLPVTKQDVATMSKEEASEIYSSEYIIKPKFHLIKDYDLRYMVIDAAVNSGQQRATMWLQSSSGAVADGIIGDKTLKAVNEGDTQAIKRKFISERINFVGRLITRDPVQSKFAAGWMKRITKQIIENV
jgi:lysozyme family protein